MNDKTCENCYNCNWEVVEQSWGVTLYGWDYSIICEGCKRNNPESEEDLWEDINQNN